MSRRQLLAAIAGLALACGGSDEAFRVVGTLERDRIELVAEEREPVVERAVREGDRVEVGQLLIRLDGTRLDTHVARARSARDRAAARLAELERGPRVQEIAEARAQLAATQSALATARLDLERVERLVTQNVESADRRDQLRGRYDEMRARRDAARAILEQLLEGSTIEQLAQAEASLAEAEALLTDVEVRAARLKVRAPIAGHIDALPYELGERPPPGGVVAVLLAEGAPYARVYVPESIRVRVGPGTAARIHVDGVNESYAGRVRTVAHDAAFTPYYALTERDRSRLSFVAKVDLTDPAARDLPTGIPVEVVFDPGADVAASNDAADDG
jgi:HlyD family secretion protein